MSEVLLRPAKGEEAAKLTELCVRSKAVWGYDAEFLAACREELTIAPVDIIDSCVQVAEVGGVLAGVCQLTFANSRANLEKLFVDPLYLGRGVGKRLYCWAEHLARRSGASEMSIEADPGAAPFYRRMGALHDGTVASGSIPGRRIPRLRVVLHQIEMEENGCPRQ